MLLIKLMKHKRLKKDHSLSGPRIEDKFSLVTDQQRKLRKLKLYQMSNGTAIQVLKID